MSVIFFRTTLHEEQISRISMCLLLLLLQMLLTMALLALKKSSQFFLHFICEGKTQHITFITCKIQEKSYNNMRNISFVREKTTKK